jgi:hypothetical protein
MTGEQLDALFNINPKKEEAFRELCSNRHQSGMSFDIVFFEQNWETMSEREWKHLLARQQQYQVSDEVLSLLIQKYNIDVSDTYLLYNASMEACPTCRANLTCQPHEKYLKVKRFLAQHLSRDQIIACHSIEWFSMFEDGYWILTPSVMKTSSIKCRSPRTLETMITDKKINIKSLHKRLVRFNFPCHTCRARLVCEEHEDVQTCIKLCETHLDTHTIIDNYNSICHSLL